MSLFINPDSEFSIKFVLFKPIDNKEMVLIDVSKEKAIEIYGEDQICDVEEHEAWFRYPTYKDTTSIADSAFTLDDNGLKISPISMRSKRLTTLIKRWTLKSEGVPIPPSESVIASLNPLVAGYLALQLESQIGLKTA